MSPDLAPNWCQAARAVVVARGCEAGVFAIGNLSPSGAWLRGALPLAVDERIKVLFHDDGGRRTVVTAKVVKHELMPRHVVQIVFEDPHARARGAAPALRATAAAAAADRPERPGTATA